MRPSVKAQKPMRKPKRFWPALLLTSLLSLTSCAGTVNSPNPPPCPQAGPAVADEVASLPMSQYPALFNYLGRLVNYCRAIDAMRKP